MQHFNQTRNVTKFQGSKNLCHVYKWQIFFVMYISDKFSVNELLIFHHISKVNTWYCVAYVAIITLFWFVTFINTYTSAHKRAHTHTHTHTHTHQIKILHFFEKIAKSNARAIETILVREVWYKRNSSFLMKTSDLIKILGELREID